MALAATPALAQQRPPQRAQPQPAAPTAPVAGPRAGLGMPISALVQRFNDKAQQLNLRVRAEQLRCGTQGQQACEYRFSRAMGMATSLTDRETLREVMIVMSGPTMDATADALASFIVMMATVEPDASRDERDAVLRTMSDSANTAGQRPTTTHLRDTEILIGPMPGLGAVAIFSQRR